MKPNQNIIKSFSFDNPELSEKLSKNLMQRVRRAQRSHIMCETFPYKRKMGRAEYLREKRKLQIELVKLQNWMKHNEKRLVIVFEGRDAAGKGGSIKRFMEHLNPRGARVVALEKPTDTERGQWYFQRYIKEFPTAGEIVFFDRSWYNRAGVEKVMGFCTPHEYRTFMNQVSEFEKMIVESNVHFVKFWFSVSREEQLRRFIDRAKDPLKQWKLSEMDFQSLSRWKEYTIAKEAMFYHTDTVLSPWKVVRSDDKKRARLNAMRFVLNKFNYTNKDKKNIGKLDPLIIGSAENIYEVGEMHHRERLYRKTTKRIEAEKSNTAAEKTVAKKSTKKTASEAKPKAKSKSKTKTKEKK